VEEKDTDHKKLKLNSDPNPLPPASSKPVCIKLGTSIIPVSYIFS